MFCTKCGTKNTDDARFCSGCGAPMANEYKTAYTPVDPTHFQLTDSSHTPQKSKNNTGLIVGIIVSVLFVVGALIAILFATGVIQTGSNREETKIEEADNIKTEGEDKTNSKNEINDENEKEHTSDKQELVPLENEFVYGKVSLVVPEDFVKSELAINEAKLFTHKDYPQITNNISMERTTNAPVSIAKEDIKTLFATINTDLYRLISFNEYTCDGYKYVRAEVEIAANGIAMQSEIYIVLVDGESVIVMFTSINEPPSDYFESTIRSIKVNGKRLGQ